VETLRIFNLISNSQLQIGKLQKAQLNGKEYLVLAIFHPSPINPNGRVKNREIFDRLMPKLKKTTNFK
jgi:uracil-DNA glycosylase